MEFPADWCSPAEFRRQLPNLHGSMHALRWELRFRATNGLLTDEVVIERRADPNASRPSLLISPSRYLARLRRLSRGAAA
jgi:hypothetical protein